jgi:transposase
MWKDAFLTYCDTGATKGGTEAINGLIELHRRIVETSRTSTTTPSECNWSAEG